MATSRESVKGLRLGYRVTMFSHLLLLTCVLLFPHIPTASNQAVEGTKMIEVTFPVKDLKRGTESRMTYTIDQQTLQRFGLNRKEIESSIIEIEADGTGIIVTPGGRRISLEQKTLKKSKVVNLTLSFYQNINLTMEDIRDDPELIPVKAILPQWYVPPHCHVKTVLLYNINGSHSYLRINNVKISINAKDGEGLMLTAINPETCQVTFQQLFFTNEFGVYRDLISAIDHLIPGRIVVLFSQSEGSFLLHPTAREFLSKLGSLYIKHYFYGDSWVWIFMKDGSTYAEALIPNLGTKDTYPQQPLFEVQLPWPKENDLHMKDCPHWPQSSVWNARRKFCQIYDSIRSICNCSSPLRLKSNNYSNKERLIPILILCGSRLRSLVRLLETLAIQSSLARKAIILIIDGYSTAIRQLAYVLSLRFIVHKPIGYKSIRVSRNLRFGLFNGLNIFPEARSFIILEDDLLLSPDFYSYMSQLSPIFEMDYSIYTVSGFNFLSSSTTSHDLTLTYRVDSHPSYGWMMPRYIIEELLPKWPHKLFFHDWDHLLAMNVFRKNRQCVIPDVNRVYHNCVQSNGIHVNPNWYGERQFLRKGLNSQSEVQLQPLHRLLKPNYEATMRQMIKRATVVNVTDVYNITLPESEAGIYVIYAQMTAELDHESFRLIGDGLETWMGEPALQIYNHTWRLFYKNCPLFVVGVPFSYYSRYKPAEAQVFSVPPHASRGLLNNNEQEDKIPVMTHRNLRRQTVNVLRMKEQQKLQPNYYNHYSNLFGVDNFPDLASIFQNS